MTLVLVLLVAAIVLFVTERLPVEVVSLLMLATLLLLAVVGPATGAVSAERWLSVPECLSGLSNPAVVTVAVMFVLSAGLEKTGALGAVGRGLLRLGRHPFVFLVVMMLAVGVVSAFVNNTATVAVFLPLVLMVCARRNLPAARMLIPLSFASQFGGVCTLIGTSTNLLVSSISERAGAGAFRMFEFTPLGVILLGTGLVYLAVTSRWLLPARRGGELTETWQLGEYLTEVRLLADSPLIGKTVAESRLAERHEVTVLEILRNDRKIWAPHETQLQAGDVLLVSGRVQSLLDLRASTGLEIAPEFELKDRTLRAQELVLVEALVAPRSGLVGRTLGETEFRWRSGAIVLALQRRGQVLREKLANLPLQFGDALLLLAQREELPKLRADENLIVLSETEPPPIRSGRALLAVGLVAAVVALAALNLLPIVVSAVLGGLAMVLTRCVTLQQAYAAMDWKVIFLLAGTLPLGLALERSGAATFVAVHTLGWVQDFGPWAVLAGLYLLTAVLTEFMSNNAAAVLLAPIAISTAAKMGVDAKPLLMAVAFAASTSFATPVGYQTNAMVYSAGGYRYADFLRIGIPLNVIFWALAVWFIPRFWPFGNA